MGYLIHMGALLAIPSFLAWHIHQESPDESPAVLVWGLVVFIAWQAHLSYGTKQDKWEACEHLEQYTGYERLPKVCWEPAIDDRDDYW